MEFSVWIDLTKDKKKVFLPTTGTLSGPDTSLWHAIRDFPLDSPAASMPFSARLARDHLWIQSYAEKVVREYRRFLYLLATEKEMVTPSEDVDEAWHLHLAYTKSYWDELCGKVVQRPLHHNPTEGDEQGAGFRAAYEQTLRRYSLVFKESPPSDIWPSSAERFVLEGGFRTVPLRDFRLVGRLTATRLAKGFRYFLVGAVILLLVLLMMLANAPEGAWFAGWVAFVFLSGPVSHYLADVSLPRWGKKGLGFAKYSDEPASSGAGGCGGCGGCG